KAARQSDGSKNRDCPDSANDLYQSAATGCHPGSGSGTSTAPTISTVSVCAFSAFVRCPIRSAARLPTGPREPISAPFPNQSSKPGCHQQRPGLPTFDVSQPTFHGPKTWERPEGLDRKSTRLNSSHV